MFMLLFNEIRGFHTQRVGMYQKGYINRSPLVAEDLGQRVDFEGRLAQPTADSSHDDEMQTLERCHIS